MTDRRRLAAVPDTGRRGVAVVRVSKTRGRPDLISPELQRTAISDYAQRLGINVMDWLEVLDESASKDRSAWWRTLDTVIGQVEAGDRDVVLVWKYNRAARHRKRWAVAIDRIEVAGGTLESATEGLDTTTSTGRLARGMLAELAAWESEVKGEQWKETHARRRANGLPHGGHDRFGYSYERGSGYTVDPETGPVLAECYQRYLLGEGHTTLAKWLNRRAIPTVRRARSGWQVQTVIRMMDSGFAAGLIHHGAEGSWSPGSHEPLISAEMWDRYRQARQLRWNVPARVREPSYPLTGLVRCGLCRCSMVVASDARYGPGYMYRCTTRMTGGTCRGPFVTRAQVEARVLEWLQELVGDVDARAQGKSARRAAAAEMRLEDKAVKRELLRLEAAGERARGFLLDETLTRDEYRTERERLDVRKAELTKRLGELAQDVERVSGPAVTVARGLLADWDTLPVKARRDLLATLLRRVEVRQGVRRAQDLRPVWMWDPDAWAEPVL